MNGDKALLEQFKWQISFSPPMIFDSLGFEGMTKEIHGYNTRE